MAILHLLKDPYASVRVAVYSPIVTQWWSVPALADLLTTLADRQASVREGAIPGGALAPTATRFALLAVDDKSATADKPVPTLHVHRSLQYAELPGAVRRQRAELIQKLLSDPALDLERLVSELDSHAFPQTLIAGGLRLAVSPIGVAQLYRQLYFDQGSGIGPIEQAFTIAPREEMQVIQEITRRDSVERVETFGSESTLEKSEETTMTDEISDEVQSSMRRDMQVAVSSSVEGSIGVWSASASGSLNLDQSRETSRDVATKHSTAQTRKATEVLRKTYSLSVKTFSELTERSTIRRTIRNDSDEPVNYGLRRVFRSVRVKLQSLGPSLIWQTFVRNPGQRLARSKLIMFREADSAIGPAPNAPPRPASGTETGSQTVRVVTEGLVAQHVTLWIAQDPSRRYTALAVVSITDASGGGHAPPAVRNGAPAGTPTTDAQGHVTAWSYRLDLVGSSPGVLDVGYTIAYEPSDAALAAWNTQVAAAQAAWEATEQDAAFERARRIVTAKSRVRPRPANDLRDEERYELMNEIVSAAFRDLSQDTLPAPAEVELFTRYFDVAAMFHYAHPSWWQPRYGTQRTDYEITEDSEPAVFGKSLGWLIQLDGDRRRNELLNSPWVRVCVPLKPGVEREAVDWLARRFEGQLGYSTASGTPLGTLLTDVETRREAEHLATPGPDYVTLDGVVPPGREAAADAYPIVDEFDIAVPTEGFIYESLTTA